MWSALPATTGVPACRPVRLAAAGVTLPMTSLGQWTAAEKGAVDRGQAQDVVIPILSLQVEVAAFECPVALQIVGAGEAMGYELVGAHEMPGTLKDLRLMVAQPKYLGADGLLRDGAPSPPEDVGSVGLAAQELDLPDGAGIILLNGVTQDVVVLVEQDDGRHHAANADGTDARGGNAGGSQAFRDGPLHVVPPLFRILFRPARVLRIAAWRVPRRRRRRDHPDRSR